MRKTARQKFSSLTDALGVTRVARELKIDVGHCSHIKSGRRRPSLEIAARIEKLSRGAIRAASWCDEELAVEVDVDVEGPEAA